MPPALSRDSDGLHHTQVNCATLNEGRNEWGNILIKFIYIISFITMGDEKATAYKKTPSQPARRPFVSPVIRRCELEDKEQIHRPKRKRSGENSKEERVCVFQGKNTQIQTGIDDELSTPASQADQELKELRLVLMEKQDTLRKLNLVKKYRKKNNLENLQEIINKWRSVSQEGATSLLNSISTEAGDKPSMHRLLQELQVEHALIHYSIENEAFW